MPGLSLLSGETGTLFAIACYLRCAEDVELRTRGESLLRDLVRHHARPGREYDLIGGAAGAIIGLLGITDVFGPELIEPFCVRLGAHLLAEADVEPVGLSWPNGSPRGGNLCGLGHGAAGIGWALLELFCRTGKAAFQVAAEEAFAYEESWFDHEVGNWPDLRNTEMAKFRYEDRMHELDALVRAGGPVPLYEVRYMTAWCHGAAGIGMSRARAFEVLQRTEYRNQAQAAARATSETLTVAAPNHSLCHGLVGNAAAQLYVAKCVGWEDVVHQVTAMLKTVAGAVMENDGHWIPGGPDREHRDPTLMLGEAGIGLVLLGLEHEVLSPLFPIPHHSSMRASGPVGGSARPVVEKILVRAYPNTSAALARDGGLGGLGIDNEEGPGARIPVAPRLGEDLRRTAGERPDASEIVRAYRGDMLALDRAKQRLDRSLLVLCDRFAAMDPPEDQALALAPWIEIAQHGDDAWLLYPTESGEWRARLLSSELHALLMAFGTTTTQAQVTLELALASASDPDALQPWVRGQVRAFGRAGILIPGMLASAIGAGEARDRGKPSPVEENGRIKP
jgi:hypothetical protein